MKNKNQYESSAKLAWYSVIAMIILLVIVTLLVE